MTKSIVPLLFSFNSNSIRTLNIDGNVWFVATDVCAALEYKNTTKAIGDHLDSDERAIALIPRTSNDSLGVETNIINESGLYALVLRSRKPEARKFAKWVTSEVLPSIRKTGCYTKQLPKLKYTALKRPSMNVADGNRILCEIKSWSRENLPRERHEELFDALTEVEAVLTKATTEMHEAIAHFSIGIHYLNRFRG